MSMCVHVHVIFSFKQSSMIAVYICGMQMSGVHKHAHGGAGTDVHDWFSTALK